MAVRFVVKRLQLFFSFGVPDPLSLLFLGLQTQDGGL
jgi:hypothetical protein